MGRGAARPRFLWLFPEAEVLYNAHCKIFCGGPQFVRNEFE